MEHGTYVGPNAALTGKTALLMACCTGWLAQFDDRSTPGRLAYGWHEFGRKDFEVDPEELN